MSSGTALVVSSESPDRRPLAPASFDEVMRWAEFIAGSGLAPDGLRGKPTDVAIVLLSGLELGVPPMMALRQLPVIKGKVSQLAEFMVARCLGSSVCEYFTCLESTEERATWEAKRLGAPAPVRASYTMAQAVKAGAGDMYRKHPAAMLRARASSALARMVFADVIGGLYSREELDDGQPEARPAPGVPFAGQFASIVTAARTAAVIEAYEPEAPSILEAPTVAPPLPNGAAHDPADALDDEVGTLHAALTDAATLEELQALVPRIRALPEADKAPLRERYNQRRVGFERRAGQ